MSDEAFEKYAIKLEMEDFEDDIRNLVNIFVTFLDPHSHLSGFMDFRREAF